MSKKLVTGDYLVIFPFAWVMTQSIIRLDFFWFFIALWMFNIYMYKRRDWDE